MHEQQKLNGLWLIAYAVGLLLSVFQLYFVKIGESYISLFLLSVIILTPLSFKAVRRVQWKGMILFLGLIFTQLLSLFWSVNIAFGVKQILIELLFVVIFLSSYILTLSYPKKIISVFRLFFLAMMVPGVLVIIFRYFPSIELAFLNSSLAKLVINPNLLVGLFSDTPNNVLDPDKSAGFNINGNVSGAIFGATAFIALGFWRAYSRIEFLLFSLLMLLFAFYTGSKAVAGLLFLSTMLFSLFINPRLKIIYFSMFLILVIPVVFVVRSTLDNYGVEVLQTTSIRLLIWMYAYEIFPGNIFFGVGFGGWQQGFEQYALGANIPEGFPPHNTLIYLWSQSGIFSVMFFLGYVFYVFKFSYKLIFSSSQEMVGLGLALMFSNMWIFIHGMGENFGVIGEDHMFILLASILGIARARYFKVGF